MANTATLVDTISARVNTLGPLYEYEIIIDTTATDLVIRTAANTAQRLFIAGMLLAEANPGNLIFKSKVTGGGATSKTKTLELAANQGIFDKVGKGFIFATTPGEDLVVQSSMAMGSLTLFVEGGVFIDAR